MKFLSNFECSFRDPNVVGRIFFGFRCKYYLHIWLIRRPFSHVYGRKKVPDVGTMYGCGRVFMVLIAHG